MMLRHIYLRKARRTKEGESEDADGKGIRIIHVGLRKADNNPDFVDPVEFLKTFKHDPRVNSRLESPSS